MSELCYAMPASQRADHPVEQRGRPTVVHAVGVGVRRGRRPLLQHADLAVAAGELIAIVGSSGAGKTTLLRVLADLEAPTEGLVSYAGGGRREDGRATVGFVPQDDIVHRELSVRSTLRYAAALRLPADVGPDRRDEIVRDLMADLGLTERADVRVGSLSGGQRKRVGIAVELLRRPDILLLDEPTSGLDPAIAADVIALLRRLADDGVAVALTTHREADVEACERMVFLVSGGRIAFDGSLAEGLRQQGASRVAELYDRFEEHPWSPRAQPVSATRPDARRTSGPAGPRRGRADALGASRQALLLARRTAEVTARNRLTLAVLLGSPLLVTAMMATLFPSVPSVPSATLFPSVPSVPSGSFGPGDASGLAPVQITFWLAFAGFFFGLTYGLLQVVVERPILERERFAGVGVGAYLASEVLVLGPLLTAVAVALLGTLRVLDRLPPSSGPATAALLTTLVLVSLSALALGLLASAAVRDPAQATLALPMLCFPQVLFAGAVVPIVEMAAPGEVMSTLLANRWTFEGLGRSLELTGVPAGAAHGSAFQGRPSPAGASWPSAPSCCSSSPDGSSAAAHRRLGPDERAQGRRRPG